MIITFVSQRLR